MRPFWPILGILPKNEQKTPILIVYLVTQMTQFFSLIISSRFFKIHNIGIDHVDKELYDTIENIQKVKL